MNRIARKLTGAALATTIGLTALTVLPATAAGAAEFAPPAQIGEIAAQTYDGRNSVVIDAGRHTFVVEFNMASMDDAEALADGLNSAKNKAERRFSRNGSGNTDKPAEDGTFQVDSVGGSHRVVANGGVVGEYDSEEEANAVANALNDEMAKHEEDGVWLDPDLKEEPGVNH